MKGYDIKVRLDDYRPLTWRDMIIPEHLTFKQLHLIMQDLWGFYDYHLSMFTLNKRTIGIMDFERYDGDMLDMERLDSNKTYIKEYFDNNDKIFYEYDFGDSWDFTIEVKKSVDYDKTYPTIKRFKGDYNPVEDCGGVYGLSNIVYEKEKGEPSEWEIEEFDMNYTQKLLEQNCDFPYDEKANQESDNENQYALPVDDLSIDTLIKGYDLYINVHDIEPFTCRNILIPACITFEELHYVLQVLLGFNNSHMYQFTYTEENKYITVHPDKDMDELDAVTERIEDYFSKTGALLYEYDFGSTWYVTIQLNKVIEYGDNTAKIINYTGDYNPVDDCGGPDEFMTLMKHNKKVFNNENKFDKKKIQKKLDTMPLYTLVLDE